MWNGLSEIFGDGLPHVGQRRARPKIHTSSHPGRVRQDGNVFSRMIGGGIHRVRVSSMIGGNYQ